MPKQDSYEIIQVNNPDKQTFEKIIDEKQPSVFTNILEGLNFNNYDLTNIKTKKKDLEKYLTTHFKYYLHPLSLKYNFILFQNKKENKTPILRQNNYRYMLAQITGIKKIILFSPNQKKYLYPDSKLEKSKVDFWDINDREKYPLFNKSKYVEIIVKNNQMVFIPYKWWYTIYDVSDNISVSCISETLFSFFFKKKK